MTIYRNFYHTFLDLELPVLKQIYTHINTDNYFYFNSYLTNQHNMVYSMEFLMEPFVILPWQIQNRLILICH